MDAGPATERVTVLMTQNEKAALDAKAREADLSVGELVRRSIRSYDPEQVQQLAELAALARELDRGNREAAAALDRALASIAETRAQLDARAAA